MPDTDRGQGARDRAMSKSSTSWRPPAELVRSSNLARFMDRHGIGSYQALVRWSVEDISRFWDAVSQDLELSWYRPYTKVLDLSSGIEWARWWLGGSFNYVHNCLDKHAMGLNASRDAIVCESEDGRVARLSYRELHDQTARCANALRELGIGKGDRVALFLPMTCEAVIAQLAVGKIGAIYTPIFSGYGAEAVAERLRDSDAKMIITCDGTRRRGRPIAMKEAADRAAALAPSVEHVIVVDHIGRKDTPWTPGRDVWWHDSLAASASDHETERTDPEDPYLIIYTSGTTGRPKGVVHVHGGLPIKGTQDMAHLFDVKSTDRVFWLTDMGWMMGPWLVAGALSLGATAVLYDGTPDHPDPGRLWSLIERHRISVFGLAPTAVRALMRSGDEWPRRYNLSSLRILGSTGEPWNPPPWTWLEQVVGEGRCPIINYSGGTEIGGGIVSGTPITALKPTSFSGPVPGMDADVVDEGGMSVRGRVGELVIRQPWPGMTRGFWKERERYVETYWSRLPGVWVHGDWALVDDDGSWYILGRSDDTIKVAGKRLGPAEVESAAAAHPGVAEAAAVGVPDQLKGEHVVIFAVLKQGWEPTDRVRTDIADVVTGTLGKALRPDKVLFVRELPKTRSGKIMRRVIRAVHLAEDPGDLSSLENARSLDEIKSAT